jgi:hypothetical protein
VSKRRDGWFDLIAFLVGVAGFLLATAGLYFIYWPAALIFSGLGLLLWSFLAARAVAHAKSQES